MMDNAHVSQALVMGMPFVKKWSANDPAPAATAQASRSSGTAT